MTGDVTDLASELEELAEAPAPPPNIDIGRARELGRRRVYTRRAMLFAGLAAAGGTATLLAPPVLRSRTAPEPAPATPPPPDPGTLTSHATFGWLPDTITRIDIGAGEYYGDHTHAVDEDDGLGTHLWLSVHPAGNPPIPPRVKDRKVFTVDAPPVNGRIAHWVTENLSDVLNGGDAFLVWQAPDGRWAVLHGYALSSFADPQAVLHRIAAGVSVAERAVPLPVRIGDLPAEYRVDTATFNRPMPKDMGHGAWSLHLSFSRGDDPAFGIQVHPEGSWTVRKTNEPGNCTAAQGVEVCLTEGEPAFLDRFTPLGMDESNWES